MTKTVCDICGEEIPTTKIVDAMNDQKFCISRGGWRWDVCDKCQESLANWMTTRRIEREDKK